MNFHKNISKKSDEEILILNQNILNKSKNFKPLRLEGAHFNIEDIEKFRSDFDQMKKNQPTKDYIVAPGNDGSCSCSNCPYMELNTLEKLRNCLLEVTPKINIDNKLILKAKKPLIEMLKLS